MLPSVKSNLDSQVFDWPPTFLEDRRGFFHIATEDSLCRNKYFMDLRIKIVYDWIK